jgi:small-conductance mechanosensitive channel
MGVVQSVIDWLQAFMAGFTPHLNMIVIFFLILFIGFLVGKILGRLVKRLLKDVKADGFVKKTLGWRIPLEKGLASLIAGLVYLISFIIALNAVGLTTIVLEVILAIFVLALVLSFLLALKDIIPNAAAGVTLKSKLKEGTYLKLDDAEGAVDEVNLLETVILTKGGDKIVIPNALFAKQRMRIVKRKR